MSILASLHVVLSFFFTQAQAADNDFLIRPPNDLDFGIPRVSDEFYTVPEITDAATGTMDVSRSFFGLQTIAENATEIIIIGAPTILLACAIFHAVIILTKPGSQDHIKKHLGAVLACAASLIAILLAFVLFTSIYQQILLGSSF